MISKKSQLLVRWGNDCGLNRHRILSTTHRLHWLEPSECRERNRSCYPCRQFVSLWTPNPVRLRTYSVTYRIIIIFLAIGDKMSMIKVIFVTVSLTFRKKIVTLHELTFGCWSELWMRTLIFFVRIFCARKPKTKRRESITFDFPLPFGPITALKLFYAWFIH